MSKLKEKEIGENTGVSRQKQKLLFMRKVLLEQTDQQHPITVNQLINTLADNGIKEERKTVYDDIATLSGSGLAIEITKVGHANAYYVCQREFEHEELFILADAVASSKFLTERKSKQLIEKLQKLTSKYQAKELLRIIDVKDRVKTFNESIFYTINQITEAISNKKMLTFQYYSYNSKMKKQLKHSGAFYKVSPYKLIWENDNYYLICYSHIREKIVHFRADRMVKVSAVDEPRREPDVDEATLIKELRSTFDMYSGTPERVTFEITENLVDSMVDKFGDKILLFQSENGKLSFSTDVQISPTFWGWLFQFGRQIKITSPQNIVDLAKSELKNILDSYN